MKRAVKELPLVLFALIVACGGFIICNLKWQSHLTFQNYFVIAIYSVSSILAHFLIAHFLPERDGKIIPIVIALNGVGLSQIFRIDHALIANGAKTASVNSQFLFSIIGIILMVLIPATLKDHRVLRRWQWTCCFFAVILVAAPLLPLIGSEINGARVWINLGPLGTVQPAEFTKILLCIFFSSYLTINEERLKMAGRKILGFQFPRLQDFAPILLVWGICLVVLIFSHDLGTSLLFFGMFIAMLFVATGKISWTVIGVGLFVAGCIVANAVFWHVQSRVQIWLDPMNPQLYNKTYGGSGQIVQGFFALASGGLFGTGIGEGYPSFTPFSNSDFIYTSLGEELGLTGLFAILVLYLLLIERAFSSALKVKDSFGKLLAAGIAFCLSLQIFVVVGGTTRIIPMTGITLPFLAKGGSSLIANYSMVALLLIISHYANLQTKRKVKNEQ